MDNTKNCPQCPRHCPVDALNCGRGRAYFSESQNGGTPVTGKPENHTHGERGPHGAPDKTTLEGLLRFCGHTLHHGGVSGDLFAELSSDEQEQLKALLAKLVASWE